MVYYGNRKKDKFLIELDRITNPFSQKNFTFLNNKEKIQAPINQQRKTLAEVEYLDLDSVAKIVQNFENTKHKRLHF